MTQKEFICPECKAKNPLTENIQVGEVVACQECSTDFEITNLNPFKLQLAPEAKEDWGE